MAAGHHAGQLAEPEARGGGRGERGQRWRGRWIGAREGRERAAKHEAEQAGRASDQAADVRTIMTRVDRSTE